MKRNITLFLVSTTLLAFILITTSCEQLFPSGDVEYKVSGTASSVFITLETSDGTAQFNADVPSSKTYAGFSSGDFVYISAQNNSSTGTVTVEIYKKGDTYKSTTSSGAYCIATASGTY